MHNSIKLFISNKILGIKTLRYCFINFLFNQSLSTAQAQGEFLACLSVTNQANFPSSS